MAKNVRRQTFAEIVNKPTWSETDASRTGRYATRPGGVNRAGEFFDLDGLKLVLVHEDASVEEAQRIIEARALVLAESCGCGGWFGDCTPEWLSEDQLRSLRGGPAPRFTDRHDAPTWIDVWANDKRTVMFVHGDVAWGTALE